jgi:lia operon protein LiaF
MNRNTSIVGWILVAIGGIFLLQNLEFRYFHLVWPCFIIILGVWLVYRALKRKESWDGKVHTEFGIGENHQPSMTGEIDGSRVSHFIGETELNLSGATLKSGVNHFQVSSFIGEIRLLIPADWAIEAHGSAFLGEVGLADRSQSGIFPNCQYTSAGYEAAEKKLKLHCSLFIGEIKVLKG